MDITVSVYDSIKHSSRTCRTPIVCNPVCYARIINGFSVDVRNLIEVETPIIVTSQSQIEAICMTNGINTVAVVTVGSVVTLWDIGLCRALIASHQEVVGVELCPFERGCLGVQFSSDDLYIGLLTATAVSVIDRHGNWLSRLDGQFNIWYFLPDSCSHLVAINNAKTFIICDWLNDNVVYESSILAPADSVNALAVDSNYCRFAVGCSNGNIFIYHYSDISCVAFILDTNISSVCEGRQFHTDILALHFTERRLPEATIQTTTATESSELKVFPQLLIIVTTSAIVILHSQTLECLQVYQLDTVCDPSGNALPMATGASIVKSVEPTLIRLICVNEIGRSSWMLNVEFNDLEENNDIRFSFLMKSPLLVSSPLRAKYKAVAKEIPDSRKASLPANDSSKYRNKPRAKVTIKDKPVTFRTRVKSSGYTMKPHEKMFQPKTIPKEKTNYTADVRKLSLAEYPRESGVPMVADKRWDIGESGCAVTSLKVAPDGMTLAAGLSSGSVVVLPTKSTGKGCVYSGSKGQITGLGYNSIGNKLVSSTTGRVVNLWSKGQKDPVIRMDNNKSPSSEVVFPADVSSCCFYYIDKFIIVASGNLIILIKYYIDETKTDDIKTYCNKSSYKLAHIYENVGCQGITNICAVNLFYSHMCIAATTNKGLVVWDMNTSQPIKTYQNAHKRPINAIALNQGSRFSGLPLEGYDYFWTSAVTDGITLWDLRARFSVRRYTAHTARSAPCGIDVSPCGRYIATGSEDRCSYIYDIRHYSPLNKLTIFKDTVIDVAFNPMYSALYGVTTTGKIHSHVP